MTERASDLLSKLAERLSADAGESGLVAAESVRSLAPEILKFQKGGSVDELVKTSEKFLELLFRSLNADSRIPWVEYYAIAREASRRYAEKGIPLEALMEGLSVFRRSVIARVTEEVAGDVGADEVIRLAHGRVGEVIEHMNSSFIRGYLDFTEARHIARQTELHGLYHIASALGRSLDVAEIAEVGLRETLQVLRLQAGAVWVREGARLKLAKTLGMQLGEEEEFTDSGRSRLVKVVEIASGPAESRVDRITGEWSAIRAELRTKGVLLGAMTVATRLPRTFESSDLEFVAAVADQIAVALDRARQHTREARTDYLTGLANRPEFERAIDRAVAGAQRHKRRLTLMMIDLDSLKDINDTHGHHVGDEAIRVLAQELQRAVRATDTCGRLGGDEFGVAMPDADERHASEVATRVRQSLEELNRAGKSPVPVQFSTGITSWRAGMDWQAMYVDKRRRHAGRRAVGQAPA
jgi:diguanylate cyclase (GGDEF)-like protein